MRKWSKLMIGFLVLFLISIIIGMISSDVTFLYLGIILMAIAWFILQTRLVCPYCNHRSLPTNWNTDEPLICSSCGKELE